MQGQSVLHVLEIDELGNLAVGIAGDVDEHPIAVRRRVQAVDRHDREQLPERPMIEERLEHREIADVLIAERRLELFHFLWNEAQTFVHGHDLLGQLPVDRVDLRL